MPPSSCLPPLCSTAQIFVLFVSDLMASSLTEYGHACYKPSTTNSEPTTNKEQEFSKNHARAQG